MLTRLFYPTLLVLTAILSCPVTVGASDVGIVPGADDSWGQWRGPARTGVLPGEDWPASLSEPTLREVWSVSLGKGYPGPLIADERVIVAETKDAKFEVVRALDLTTGKQLWETQWEGSMSVPFFAKTNGDWIRSTPCVDGNRVYVAGMRDVLACLDLQTGDVVWRKDFVEELKTPLPAFGFVSSPLILGDDLYVQAGASFLKLNKHTGELVWRSLEDDGGMYGSAFSSCFFAPLQGQEQLVVQTRTKLAGVDPAGGQVLWSQEIPAFRGMNILTPTVYEDGILTSSYGGRTILLQPTRDATNAWTVSEKWSDKTQGYMSTPVVIDGYAYMHLRNQRFSCIRLSDGKEMWRSKTFGKYCSLIARGKTILALDERGELLLIAATPDEFRLIDRRQVSEQSTWAHLASAGPWLAVRELEGLKMFRWNSATPAAGGQP
jgi:outer membrane protein assembly factor BamB